MTRRPSIHDLRRDLEEIRDDLADDDADPGPNVPELTDEEKEILDEAFDVEVPTQIEP